MIAVPIGPREQRYALAASPGYLERHGRPNHPRKLLDHACLRVRFGGARIAWEFERDGEPEDDPPGPLTANLGNAVDLRRHRGRGHGILYLFEDWLRPPFESGALKPVLSAGGFVSPVPSSTTRAVATCRPRSVRSSTSHRTARG